MNKRGQVYLVAALVIIGIIIGLAATYNITETPREETTIFDLSKEINFEAGQVIDSGIFYSLTEEERGGNIENLTDYYGLSAYGGTDFLVIYGNNTEMTAVSYATENTGNIGLGVGSITTDLSSENTRRYSTTFNTTGEDSVTLLLADNINHTFNINPGQTFFIIIKKERQGERYISASEPDQSNV